jgi:hypothetical protein
MEGVVVYGQGAASLLKTTVRRCGMTGVAVMEKGSSAVLQGCDIVGNGHCKAADFTATEMELLTEEELGRMQGDCGYPGIWVYGLQGDISLQGETQQQKSSSAFDRAPTVWMDDNTIGSFPSNKAGPVVVAPGCVIVPRIPRVPAKGGFN